METKHNLNMARTPLTDSINHSEVLADALSSNTSLTKTDINDVKLAFEGLSNGISKLLEYSKNSESENKELDNRIDVTM